MLQLLRLCLSFAYIISSTSYYSMRALQTLLHDMIKHQVLELQASLARHLCCYRAPSRGNGLTNYPHKDVTPSIPRVTQKSNRVLNNKSFEALVFGLDPLQTTLNKLEWFWHDNGESAYESPAILSLGMLTSRHSHLALACLHDPRSTCHHYMGFVWFVLKPNTITLDYYK